MARPVCISTPSAPRHSGRALGHLARMRVSIASSRDAQELARIQLEAWRAAYRGLISDAALGTHNLQERAGFWSDRLGKATGSVFIAEQDGIVGFCDFIPSEDQDEDPDATGEIAAIYVEPKHWRRGAGRALCQHALGEARRRGYRLVTVWALEEVNAAREFYGAMGFSLDGARKAQRLPDGSDIKEIRFRIRL
jgi:GNAT superfamily N-acetyltransferase